MINFFLDLFVPKDNFWTNNFNSLDSKFKDKFQFISQIDDVIGNFSKTTFSEEVYSVSFPKYNVDINFSWYEPYRLKFKNILTGAFALIFVGAIVKRNDPHINLGGN